jgi:hypothetical protein
MMNLKHVSLDTDDMSFEEVDALIQELRKVRERKGELRSRLNMFRSMITNMRNEEGMTLVSNTTGEVLNPDDWELYDETTHTFYHEGEDK